MSQTDYVAVVFRALDKLAASPLTLAGTSGLSQDDIRNLGSELGVQFSASYECFLSRVGRSAGGFLVGTDFVADRLLEINAAAREIVDEEPEAFDESGSCVFAFAMHQGYQFLFVNDPQCDAAPVFRYLEGAGVVRVADSFAAWLEATVGEEIANSQGPGSR
jgi:hypothetical protein